MVPLLALSTYSHPEHRAAETPGVAMGTSRWLLLTCKFCFSHISEKKPLIDTERWDHFRCERRDTCKLWGFLTGLNTQTSPLPGDRPPRPFHECEKRPLLAPADAWCWGSDRAWPDPPPSCGVKTESIAVSGRFCSHLGWTGAHILNLGPGLH